MIQRFTWKVTPPSGCTVDQVCERLRQPVGHLYQHNLMVVGAGIDLEEDHLLLLLDLQTRDRWWAKRKAPYLLAGLLAKSQLQARHVQLQDVHELPNLKSARFWTGPGRSGRRVHTPPEGQDPPQPKPRRRMPKMPAHWLQRSGWHQEYRGTGY